MNRMIWHNGTDSKNTFDDVSETDRYFSMEVNCESLEKADLTLKQLQNIAGLIYDTDPYIYPALFSSRDNAMTIIPSLLLNGNDEMFNLNNIYCAFAGDEIGGIILWNQGPLNWNEDAYLGNCHCLNIDPSEHLKQVSTEYFADYDEVSEETISIINVCIRTDLRGMGIGKKMMNQFIESYRHKCSEFELMVLADNDAAVNLYHSLGFDIVRELNGFSLDHRDLPCFQMVLKV